MEVPLQHVVGTIALIALVAAAGISYQVFASYIEANVYKTQLGQIAESIASNLIEVISLADFGGTVTTNQTLIRTINLPTSLNERAYLVRVVNISEVGTGEKYYVQAELVTRKDIYARALIPVSSNSNIILYTEGFADYNINGTVTFLVRGGKGGLVRPFGSLYGGASNFQDSYFVVWSWKYQTDPPIIYAGIGIWSSGGG